MTVRSRKPAKRTWQRAWKFYKARPLTGAADPGATKKDYCVYHPPYKSYTYSQAWVDFLVNEIADDERWATLLAYNGDGVG